MSTLSTRRKESFGRDRIARNKMFVACCPLLVWFTIPISFGIFFCLRYLLNAFFWCKPDTNNTRKGRKCGCIETLYHHVYEDGKLLATFVSCIESKKKLSDEALVKALTRLSQRHPLLRMRITEAHEGFNRDVNYYFNEIENFKVDYTNIDFCAENVQDWHEAFRTEILKCVDTLNGPLWRVARLKQGVVQETGTIANCLVLTFHHAITDAISVVNFLDELMDILSTVDEPNDQVLENFSLLPPCEEMLQDKEQLPLYTRLTVNIVATLASFGILSLKSKRNWSYFKKYPLVMSQDPAAEQDTRALFTTFSEEDTQELVEACRKQGCTVTGAITAATSIAMCQILQNDQVTKEEDIPSGCLVSIRSKCDHDVNKYFGVFSTRMSVNCRIRPHTESDFKKVFWNTAREGTNSIHEGIKKNDHLKILKMTNSIILNTTKMSFFDSFVDRKRGGRIGNDFFCNSNAGRFDLSKGHKRTFEVCRLFFGVAEHERGIIYINNTVTINGKLCWTLIYYPNITRKEQAMEFSQKIFSNIKNAITGS